MNLQSLCERIVRDAIPATDSGATCFVPRYQIDQLREALSAHRPPASDLSSGDKRLISPVKPLAEAQADEVVCLECGQPTMHMGQVCYACSHPAAKPAEAQAQGGGEVVAQCDQYVDGGWTGVRKCSFKAMPGDTLCKRHRATAERTGYDAGASAPTSVPVGVEGLREIYSAVIRALAAIVTTGGSDKIEELGAIPRSPVMDQVAAIRGQMDKLSALAQQPASDEGFTAADMMDARQEGRKEAQHHAAVGGEALREVVDYLCGIGELEGRNFGDDPPYDLAGRRTPYWWREHLRRAAAPHIAAQQPAAVDGAVDFEIHAGGEYFASVGGPRERAWNEAMHYVSTLSPDDGEPEVFEVTRRKVALATQPGEE